MKTLKIIGIVAACSLAVFVISTAANAQSVSSTATSTTGTSTVTTATTTATSTTDTASSTNAPIYVGCYGSASSNMITWTASATGGTPPYTFLWSGDPSVAGSSSTSITATYNTSGTYNASIQATDAASAIATGNCSAVVAVEPSSTATSSLPDAQLQITDSVDNAAPQEGATVNYTINISALGPATSTGVMATDMLPSGLTFVSATSSQGTYTSSTGAWDVGDLAVGSNAMLTIQATVNSGTAGTSITNTANVSESPTVVNTDTVTSSSATITVATNSGGGGGGGGTTTSTPSSTPVATINIPPMLTINPNGNVTAKGMLVTSVTSDSFQGQIWGITYTVNWDGQMPRFFSNEDTVGTSTSPGQQLNVGDMVGVSGLITSSTPLTIDASVVRDYSIFGLRPPRFWYNGNGSGTTVGSQDPDNDGDVDQTTTSSGTAESMLSAFQVELNNLTTEFQNLQKMFGG